MKIEGPYNDSVEILHTQLKILSESKFDQEELIFFLYQNILPQVQHQYIIYSTIVVVIDFFEKYIKGKSHDECMDILDFLVYIFRVHIREENMILVPICSYNKIQSNICHTVEGKYYKLFKRFYSRCFKCDNQYNLSDYRSIYYATLLGDPSKLKSQLLNLLKDKRSEIVFNAQISLMLVYFKSIQSDSFDNLIGKSILKFCNNTHLNTLFGSGEHQIIFWCTKLYMDCIDNIHYQIEDINKIMELYSNDKDNSNDELEDINCFHNILIENISSILFRCFWGINKVISRNRLSMIQNFFLKKLLLHNTHTNTLLYCGVLPYKVSIKQVTYCPTIYDCYSFNQTPIGG